MMKKIGIFFRSGLAVIILFSVIAACFYLLAPVAGRTWSEMLTGLQGWDGGHYLTIAGSGYGSERESFAFFPLLPLEIKGAAFLTGLSLDEAAWLIMIINASGLIAAGSFFYRQIYKETDRVWEALFLSLCLPFAGFFLTLYTESIFLALSLLLLTIIFYRPDLRYFLPILAVPLTLVRPTGILVAGAGLIYLAAKEELWRYSIVKKKRRLVGLVSGTVLAAVGSLFAFFYHNLKVSGDFWASIRVQAMWGRSLTGNVAVPVWDLFRNRFIDQCLGRGGCPPDMLYMVISFSLLTIGFIYIARTKIFDRWQKILIAGLSAILVLLALASNSTASISRYILVTPVYFLGLPLAIEKRFWRKYIPLVFIILGMFLITQIFLFASGIWVA